MFDNLYNLIYTAGSNLLTIGVKRLLLGAGLGIGTYQSVTTILDKLILDANSQLASGDGKILSLIGLSGADIAISVILSACVIRATISSTSIILTKFD